MVGPLVLPALFLGVAVIDDLCFQKFHNWLFISLSTVGLVAVGLLQVQPPTQAIGGFFTGAGLMLPLVLMGIVGAGDMKFMMCFGIIMGIVSTFEIFVLALFWGAAIGVAQSLFAGNIRSLISNLKGFAYKLTPAKVQKIPYTVAILMGWLTLVFNGGVL